MNILKLVLGGLKAPAEAVVAQLKANRDANIAKVEQLVGAGEGTAVAGIEAFASAEASKNAELSLVYNSFVKGPLSSELSTLESEGNTTVPALYDAGVAFLEKEADTL